MHAVIRSLVCVLAALLLGAGTASPAFADEPLKLGVHPYLSASELVKRFTPLAVYLEKELGLPVVVEVSGSYDMHVQKLGQGSLDLAFLGAASYVKLTEQFGKRPILAAYKTREGKVYRGHIMVRKDSPITSIRQLRGKRFVFGDHTSTMSHYVPRYLLLKEGISLRDFSEATYVANHDNIALGILAGSFDAGAVKEEVFLKYEPQGLRSLAKSPPIADHVFVARKGLPQETIRKAREALLRLSDDAEGKAIIAGLRSDVIDLVPAEDHDYDPLREIIRVLRRAGIEP